ncbi:cobalamin B12-binding domain-containing protein [Propionispira raffinosivorans]|uniref:cobalamin B12-binding domain-containing protein n=1 Tax=Propionispira raffinosivorans TaxID=86959 RepID=UPI0003660EAB|nr:cobalamin-dependent protein [Propionispira raffinosivorans]
MFSSQYKKFLFHLKPISLDCLWLFKEKKQFLLTDAIQYLNRKQTTNYLYQEIHFNYMSNIFQYADYNLLTYLVIWWYRTGKNYNTILCEFKAWKYAIQKNISKNDNTELINVYDSLIKNHKNFIKIAESNVNLLKNQLLSSNNLVKEQFLQIILAGEKTTALDLTEKYVHDKETLKDFYLTVIQACLYDIGYLWETQKISVAQEHLASAIVINIMTALYSQYVLGDHKKGTAILATVFNEYHEIGARMSADLLEADSWDVHYLGSNTETNLLLKEIDRLKPDIIGLSISMPYNLANASEIIQAIKKRTPPSTLVIVGGNIFNYAPDIWIKLKADNLARNAEEFLNLANNHWCNLKKNTATNEKAVVL